jgi:hypothetical protein
MGFKVYFNIMDLEKGACKLARIVINSYRVVAWIGILEFFYKNVLIRYRHKLFVINNTSIFFYCKECAATGSIKVKL